jgi:hypothetical protein
LLNNLKLDAMLSASIAFKIYNKTINRL